MDRFEGIEVDIVSEGRILPFYDDPDEHEETGGNVDSDTSDDAESGANDASESLTRKFYVEAITGAKFEIQVRLNRNFTLYNLRPDDAVRVRVSYDGHVQKWYADLSRRDIEWSWAYSRDPKVIFKEVSWYDSIRKHWSTGDTTFGSLTIKENSGSNATPAEATGLGSLKIEIERTRRTRHDIPRPPSAIAEKFVTEVSEKSMKGKAVDCALSLTGMRPTAGPPASEYDARALAGFPGATMTYHVLYRSRKALQSLGCIPRSPTPEPALRDELQTLRARLALLERNGNIKSESSVPAVVKRERETGNDERANKRSRGRSGAIETVDLTGD